MLLRNIMVMATLTKKTFHWVALQFQKFSALSSLWDRADIVLEK